MPASRCSWESIAAGSKVQHQWIWEQGGGYFGAPLTNYLGWFFTVYLFLQLFALFVRFRPGKETARTFPRSHYAQAVLTYAVMGLTPVLTFVIGGSNSLVTDAAGVGLADQEHRRISCDREHLQNA